MARIIEISNKAYEARDAAQAEMSALKGQADKEQQEFEQEWKGACAPQDTLGSALSHLAACALWLERRPWPWGLSVSTRRPLGVVVGRALVVWAAQGG